MIADAFDEDDFVVVKIDIDAPWIEIPLAKQLLQPSNNNNNNNNNSSVLPTDLVDVLYFEHHVAVKELAPFWGDTMVGSIQDSIELFAGLREQGIAAHYWI